MEWIERRAETIAEREGPYGVVMKACTAYVKKFLPREEQTAVNIDRLRKLVKNASDEWRIIDRRIKAARAGYDPLRTSRGTRRKP